MIRKALLPIAVLAALSSGAAMAQGVSGVSGISGGAGIDFAASSVPGANQGSVGGFAAAVDGAFGGGPGKDGGKKGKK